MKRAFTLIELLVVIAIIAILAAILFPVFAAAKAQAKDTSALNNIKQTSLAVLMYANDYEDYYPLAATWDPSEWWWVWQEKVYRYSKNWDVHLDPRLPRPAGGWYYWQRLGHIGAALVPNASHSAGVNGFYEWQGHPDGPVMIGGLFGAGITDDTGWYNTKTASSYSTTMIDEPSHMWLVGEAGNWDMWFGIFGDAQTSNLFGWCGGWIPGDAAAVPNNWSIIGPHARKNSVDGRRGWNIRCLTPNGKTIFASSDGSATNKDYRGDLRGQTRVRFGDLVLRAFWPD